MSETKTSNPLVQRVGSGLVAVVVLLALLFWGGAWGTYALSAMVLLWGQYEYARLAFGAEGQRRAAIPLLLPGAAITLAVQTQDFVYVSGALVIGLLFTAWWVLFTPRQDVTGMHNEWARLLLGLVYVPLPLAFFPLLRLQPDGQGLGWVILAFAATWGGDSGGFLVGRKLGRTKLFPMVSPKKTWEGLAGGVLGSIALTLAFKYGFFPFVRVVDCLIFGTVVNMAGVTGDLVESMLKRDAGVKDSGQFLPGHGGMLDRIDSVLFTLPLAWLYVKLFT